MPLTERGEHFLGIETLGGVVRMTLVRVAPETKTIEIMRSITETVSEAALDDWLTVVPRMLATIRLPVQVTILALLDQRRATIVSTGIQLTRSDSHSEIRQAELDNLISQGLWKVANAERAAVALKMNISEQHVTLADADVLQVRLGGHRVVNPVGFTAKAIEFCFRETFVDDRLFKRLNAALTEDNLHALYEAPVIIANFVARLDPQARFLFVSVGLKETAIYYCDQMVMRYIDSFAWGGGELLSGVASQFGVPPAVVERIFDYYQRGEVSRAMRRAIEAAASGELAMLSNGIATHEQRYGRCAVYVHSTVGLPGFLFDPAFARRLGLNLKLTAVNETFIGEHSQFSVHLRKKDAVSHEYTFDALIAAIIDTYAVAATTMSRAAKQRARWTLTSG